MTLHHKHISRKQLGEECSRLTDINHTSHPETSRCSGRQQFLFALHRRQQAGRTLRIDGKSLDPTTVCPKWTNILHEHHCKELCWLCVCVCVCRVCVFWCCVVCWKLCELCKMEGKKWYYSVCIQGTFSVHYSAFTFLSIPSAQPTTESDLWADTVTFTERYKTVLTIPPSRPPSACQTQTHHQLWKQIKCSHVLRCQLL